jgi:predicted small lipoprotein YifL
MRRLLAAAVLVAALGVAAGCGTEKPEPLPEADPAEPQRQALGWQESYGKPGSRLVFRVESFAVVEDGWHSIVSVENDSQARFSVASGTASLDQAFGVMLLPNGDLGELERLNQAGELPAIRAATSFAPELPGILEPGQSWRGTIGARGSLPAGAWVRVVFGAFLAMGTPPAGLEERVVWITDHAHRLRGGGGTRA